MSTLWGASGGPRSGLSGLQEWTRIDNVIRSLNGGFGMEVRRTYQSNIPATIAASDAGPDVGKRASAWTFAITPWGQIASGSKDTAINNFLDSHTPGHIIYVGFKHEPEDDVEENGFQADDWRQDVAALANLIVAHGDPEIIPHFALMSWTAKPGSGRDIDDYNPAPYMDPGVVAATVAGQDGYGLANNAFPHDIFDPFVEATRGWGFQRQAIWETGIRDVNVRSEWFVALSDWCAEQDIEVMTYFHTDNNPGDGISCWIDDETYDSTATETFAQMTALNAGATIPELPPIDPPEPAPDTNVSETIYVYPFGGVGEEGPTTRTNAGWWVEVRDFWDPDTIISQSHIYNSMSFVKSLNDPGVGEVKLSLDDPLVATLLPDEHHPQGERLLLTFPSYWSFIQDGAERFRMIYDTKTKDRLKANEAEIVQINGVGLAEHLAWAIVLPNAWPGDTKAKPRKREDQVWAELFVTLWEESKDRKEIPDWMRLSFTKERDSYGRRWQTLGDREVEIGTNLLDYLQATADTEEFDWMVTPSGVVHAAPILGSDLTETVRFFGAVTNNEVSAFEDRKDVRTIAYVEGTAGRISKAVTPSGIRRWGRRAMYLRSEEASSERQRLRVARGTLRQTRRPLRERTVKVPLNPIDPQGNPIGRTAFVDYGVGDLVGLGPQISEVDGQDLDQRNVRVNEIGITVSDGQEDCELVVDVRAERFEERVRRLLQQRFGAWSSAKTARQGKVPIANLRDTDAEFPQRGEVLVFDDEDELWRNGKAGVPFVFGYKGPLAVIPEDEEMRMPVDGQRRIVRITAELNQASSSGPVVLRLKRSGTVVHTLTLSQGEHRERELVSIPLSEDDNLALVIVDEGTGAAYLQYVAETGV